MRQAPPPLLVPALLIGAALAAFGWRARRAAAASTVYRFDPLRLSLEGQAPPWLTPPLARAFFAAYARACPAPFPLLDEQPYRAWLASLSALPWIAELHARRLPPRSVLLDLRLRRPAAVVAAEGGGTVLLGADGVAIPAPGSARRQPPPPGAAGAPFEGALPFGLPWLVGGPLWPPASPGERAAFRQASAIAAEWRDRLEPRARRILSALRGRPRASTGLALAAVDLGRALDPGARPDTAEFALLVRARGGRLVRLLYGHGPETPFERIPWEEKALVLARILRRFPGLAGLVEADLRFPNRWFDRLVRRP